MRIVILFFVVVLVQLSAPEYVSFQPCEEGNTVLNLAITKCKHRDLDGWSTCVLKHGAQVHVKAFFFSPISTNSPEIMTTGTFGEVEIVLPDSGGSPCDGSLKPRCPIHEGGVYEFIRDYEVPMTFPVGPFVIQIGIRDSRTRKYAGCARLPLIIERNPKLKYDF